MPYFEVKENGQAENFSGQNIVRVSKSIDNQIRISHYNSHYGESNCQIPHITTISFPVSMLKEVAETLNKIVLNEIQF